MQDGARLMGKGPRMRNDELRGAAIYSETILDPPHPHPRGKEEMLRLPLMPPCHHQAPQWPHSVPQPGPSIFGQARYIPRFIVLITLCLLVMKSLARQINNL